MRQYAATYYTPGYLPDGVEPAPLFSSATDAWLHLAELRGMALVEDGQDPEKDYTVKRLRGLARDAVNHPLMSAGAIGGTTPGYDGDHDLGVMYSVEALDVTYAWRVSEEHETFGPGETAEIYRLMSHEIQGDYDATIAVVHVDDAEQLTRRLNETAEEN